MPASRRSAFGVIAIGAAGSVVAGVLSDRRSRASAAGQALRWSAGAAVFTGFLVDATASIVVVAGLVWGCWVVADRAQFSAIATESGDPPYVGTALTVQLAAGFTLTVFLVSFIHDAAGWGWAFALLSPGPILGTWAMRSLERNVA